MSAGSHAALRHPRAVAPRDPTPAHASADREEFTVPHVLVHQRISEFRRWKEVFDRLGPARAAASCRSTAVFRNREDPHEVVVLFDFDDLARARQHMGSAELRQAWQDAGVTDPGTRSVLDAVEARR
jgi:quinol monooxygenase YgiN